MARFNRWEILLGSTFAGLALWKWWALAAQIVSRDDLPQWDAAKYGLAGLQLAEALRRGDLVELVTRISGMSSWPPFFPILEAPAFLVFGPEYQVPRLLMSLLFLLSLAGAVWAATGIDRRDGLLVGVGLASCLVSSPYFQTYSALVMLEVPGVFWWLVAMGCYGRALESSELKAWRATAVAGLALFFCKFNYGLLWLIPLIAHELYRRSGSWVSALRVLRQGWVLLGLRGPWPALVFLWGALILWIRWAGGLDLDFFGTRIRATSIGNPVYFSYLLLLISAVIRPGNFRDIGHRFGAVLDPAARCLLVWTALPVGVWMLIPPHVKDFFGFVENRSSDLAFWSLESWAFYPEALAEQYARWPMLGWALLVLGFLPLGFWKHLKPGPRMVVLSVLTTAFALQWHPYKLPRFATSLAVPLWLSGCWLVIRALRALTDRGMPKAVGGPARVAFTGLFFLLAGSESKVLAVETGLLRCTVPAQVRPVLDVIAERAAVEKGVLVLGTWNLLSPGLVEWHVRQQNPGLAKDHLPELWRDSRRMRRQALGRLREVPEVFWLETLPVLGQGLHSEHGRETAWLHQVRNELTDSGTFSLLEDMTFPEAGYRIRRYRRSSSSPGGVSRIPLASNSSMAKS